jgi:hypothetical protein
MDPFADATMMANRSQNAITAATHPYLSRELVAASRAIRNECRWHVAPAEALSFKRRTKRCEDVWLPASHIQEITAVKIDGTAWTDLSGVEFDELTGWTNLAGRVVEIDYIAGYDYVPEDIEAMTLELAAGALGAPLAISREQAGGVAVTYSRTSGALTAQDQDRLSEYRLGRLP